MQRNKRIIYSILMFVLLLTTLKSADVINYNNSKEKHLKEISANSLENGITEMNEELSEQAKNNGKDINNTLNNTSVITSNNSINRCIQNSVSTEIKKQSLKIIAVGDIMLGRGVEYHLNRLDKDYTYPFQYVADILRKGDIVFGNLESPLTESTHSLDENGKIVLRSSEKAAEGIKYAGFNILNLANNHIMDYYEKGLLDTISVLDKHEIVHAGAGKNIDEARKPAILEKNGFKIAVLAYTDMAELIFKGNPMLSFNAGEEKSGVAPRIYEFIKEDMESIRESVDILIVSLHWGVENSFDVTEEQRKFAYNILDNGADIILGHHPHRFQGVEIYNGKPIIYSLGNFIFDQNDPNNQESFIVSIEITENKLSSLELIPVRTKEKTHVIIPKGDEAIDILKRELELCGKLGSKCAIAEQDIIKFNIK